MVWGPYVQPLSCPKVSSLLATLHIPSELLPASAVSRAAHGLFTEDPLFTVLVRCACLPLGVLLHYLREEAEMVCLKMGLEDTNGYP